MTSVMLRVMIGEFNEQRATMGHNLAEPCPCLIHKQPGVWGSESGYLGAFGNSEMPVSGLRVGQNLNEGVVQRE